MRCTTPFEPFEPAPPLSFPIKGRHAPWANLPPTTLNPEPFFLLQNTDELAIILITQGKRKSFSDVFQRQGGW